MAGHIIFVCRTIVESFDYFWFVHLFRIVLGFISGVITLSILVVYDCNFWNPNELSWLQILFECVCVSYFAFCIYEIMIFTWGIERFT